MSVVQLHPRLSAFKKSPSFDAFADALDEAIEKGNLSKHLLDALEEAQKKGSVFHPTEDGMIRLQITLSKVNFSTTEFFQGEIQHAFDERAKKREKSWDAIDPKTREVVADAFKPWKTAVEKAIEEGRDPKSWAVSLNHKDNPYFYFTPGLELDEPLNEIFGELNPGHVVGEYMRGIFPTSAPYAPECLSVVADESMAETVRLFIAAVCATVFPSGTLIADVPDWQAPLLMISDIFGESKGRSAQARLMTLLSKATTITDYTHYGENSWTKSINKNLFLNLLWHWHERFASDIESQEDADGQWVMLFFLVSLFPIGGAESGTTIQEESADEGINKLTEGIVKHFDFDLAQEKGRLPIIPWLLYSNLLYSFWEQLDNVSYREMPDDGEEQDGIQELLPFLAKAAILVATKKYVIDRHAGPSPLGIDEVWHYTFLSMHINNETPADLGLILGNFGDLSNFADYGGHFHYGLGCLSEEDEDQYKQFDDEGQWRHRYLELVRLAKEDSFYELSNAFLAFFIVAYFSSSPNRSMDWREFSPVLLEGLNLPGKAMVRKAIEFVSEQFPSENKITRLQLASFASKPAVLHVIPGQSQPLQPHDPRRSMIIQDLELDFGGNALGKLFPEAYEFLIDSEVDWRRQAGFYGTKEKNNWSGLVQTYASVFEADLKRRLGDPAGWPAEAQIDKDAKPMLGTCIALLRRCDKKSVKDFVQQTGLDISRDNYLIEDMDKKLNPVRIKASHGDPNTEKDLLFVRNLLFKDGLLRRYLAVLT